MVIFEILGTLFCFCFCGFLCFLVLLISLCGFLSSWKFDRSLLRFWFFLEGGRNIMDVDVGFFVRDGGYLCSAVLI